MPCVLPPATDRRAPLASRLCLTELAKGRDPSVCSVLAPLHSLEMPAGGTVQSPPRPLSHLRYTEPPASPLLPALYRASHVPSPTCTLSALHRAPHVPSSACGHHRLSPLLCGPSLLVLWALDTVGEQHGGTEVATRTPVRTCAAALLCKPAGSYQQHAWPPARACEGPRMQALVFLW